MNKISWWRTGFGEEEIRRIADTLRQEHISQGPVTAEFERRIAGILKAPYVLATVNGSTAILMALIAAGVGPGDEVIVPNQAWVAAVHAPLLLGAKVVLVDVESERPVIDVAQIEKKITKKTKVIIPVHLNGRSANMKEVSRIAAKYSLTVIEDAAQAFCSKNKDGMLGTQSFAGCFSLAVTKIISTGQGGFVVTKNRERYERLRLMRTHGVSDMMNISYSKLSFNFRLTDIQASIGIAQLGRLSDRIKKVKTVYAKYEAGLSRFSFLKFLPVDIAAGEIPIYVEVLCRERNRLMRFLAERGIQTRAFYPDLDSAPYFKHNGNFPHSRLFSRQGLSLPCGPEQPLGNIDRVIETLERYK